MRPRNAGKAALGAFIDSYIAGCADLKPRSLTNMRQVRRWLVDCFGETRDLRTIGSGDAEEFRLFRIRGGLGENTIRRHIGRARQLFKAATRRELFRGSNPFDGMSSTVRADKSRMVFIDRATGQKVLDACPDAQWRLMFLRRLGLHRLIDVRA